MSIIKTQVETVKHHEGSVMATHFWIQFSMTYLCLRCNVKPNSPTAKHLSHSGSL